MNIKKANTSIEKTILTAMIVDTNVLSDIAGKWKDKMFPVSWCNLVGRWCVDYYNSHGKAPMHHIETIFKSWGSESKDEDTIALIEKFLQQLSDNYGKQKKASNSSFILDIAGKFFNRSRVSNLIDVLQGDLDKNDVRRAFNRISEFEEISMGQGAVVDVFQDESAINRAFSSKAESLVDYPGALGKFLGNSLSRDSFVAFIAPEKRGKSWWLMDVAYRAALNRRKVLMFQIGDMSESQIMMRFAIRAAGAPEDPDDCVIQYPVSLERKSNTEVDLERKEKKLNLLTFDKAKKAFKKVMEEKIKSVKNSYLKLSVHPNNSIGINQIKGMCKDLSKRGWCPDLVVIDYADLIAAPPGMMESRDAINYNWKGMRSLSQELHCLVLTATQADAGSYDANIIGMKNFTDDKRKNAHVTGMLSINQSTAEKESQIYRIGWVVRRGAKFSPTFTCFTAGCLEVGNPAILSC